MDTVEILRTVIGVFFILYGLGVYAYDKAHKMKYIEFRYSPIDWLICILVGIGVGGITIERIIYFAIVALILWTIEKSILLKMNEKKEKLKRSM